MRVLVAANGTRGDVQPLLALARSLHVAGHVVEFVTDEGHASLLAAYNFAARHRFPVPAQTRFSDPFVRRAMETGSMLAYGVGLVRVIKRHFDADAAVLEEAFQAFQPDLLVTHPLTKFCAIPVAHAYGLDASAILEAALQPQTRPTRYVRHYAWEHDLSFLDPLDRAANGGLSMLYHVVVEQQTWMLLRGKVAGLARRLRLPWGAVRWGDWKRHVWRVRSVYGWSGEVLRQPADWNPREAVCTGFWYIEQQGYIMAKELDCFLEPQGPKALRPVCVGFGSMTVSEKLSRRLTERVLRAGRDAGVRLVLLGGWGGIGLHRLHPKKTKDYRELVAYATSNVIEVKECPHEQMFPRCAAVVHHGGAGTTAACMKAGVPQIITPFWADQQFFAGRVQEMGCGLALAHPRRASTKRIKAALIQALFSSGMRNAAADVAFKVAREPGVKAAVRAIEEACGHEPSPAIDTSTAGACGIPAAAQPARRAVRRVSSRTALASARPRGVLRKFSRKLTDRLAELETEQGGYVVRVAGPRR
ncbi:unnamed protein product [Pedinophyceae sp. YPF-701]|nr:unnamed protein product [Pedinophyceae sp. YPF-701]